MPYIRISTTHKLSEEKQAALVDSLGKALEAIPGKNASGLIVDIEDGKSMFRAGEKQESLVFADVRYFSNYKFQIKRKFTAAVFEAIGGVLGTSKEKMFLTITEYNNWGGGGDFRDEYYSE